MVCIINKTSCSVCLFKYFGLVKRCGPEEGEVGGSFVFLFITVSVLEAHHGRKDQLLGEKIFE